MQGFPFFNLQACRICGWVEVLFVMDIADRFVEYVHDLNYRDLPVQVVEAAKKVVLDTLASMVAGTSAPGIDILVSLGRHGGQGHA